MQTIPETRDDRKLILTIFVFLTLTFGGLVYLAAKMQPTDEAPPPPAVQGSAVPATDTSLEQEPAEESRYGTSPVPVDEQTVEDPAEDATSDDPMGTSPEPDQAP